jgi:hypothetical protein
MKNISISNVYAEVPLGKPDAGYNFEGPIEDLPRNISPASIVGLVENKIQNVTLKNIQIVYPGSGNPLYAKRGLTPAELDGVPEMREAYPEFSQFKELPAWGFYVRHAEGITFENVTFTALKKDYRPSVVLDDVKNATFSGLVVNEPESVGKQQVFPYKTSNLIIK